MTQCKQFKCVAQLSAGLKQSYAELQTRLQRSLAEVCLVVDGLFVDVEIVVLMRWTWDDVITGVQDVRAC